ncbi:class I SAM-dependent methyltransferase [Sphingomonas sp. S1-29]|uniref:class I SAM-dependent methyltransferase n=1 Tax=Sphingomonas sp. S1-29 TaxID=2991074 RepID=UPI002240320C|nr:methyltransferase domain-containing protein [Sphingomonas sp. S1-29]UZK68068.1 class I SAM-dependent methyltransferase [Sphingomonas sp. S1-29]
MLTIVLAALCLSGCEAQVRPPQPEKVEKVGEFPPADRPVATIVSSRWSTEEARDRVNEAEKVMDRAGIKAGMTVADIGAGEGYYTVRLAERVGENGRVLAQDIVPEVRDALAERVARDGLDNVSVRLGLPADPKLPENSFDRVLLVHMYHEIAEPYEFLWRLHPSLRGKGEVIVVDADRQTQNHGTPPALLKCEFEAVGYRQVRAEETESAGGYMAVFRADRPRPAPDAIRGCRIDRDPALPAPTATDDMPS